MRKSAVSYTTKKNAALTLFSISFSRKLNVYMVKYMSLNVNFIIIMEV